MSRFEIDNLHDYLRLEEGIGQLWVMEQQLSGFLRVVLDKPLHLFH